MSKIGVIGAGAWGTSLASVMQRAGNHVVLQAHEPETVVSINNYHVNNLFLPDVVLDPKIRATTRIDEATDADAILLVAPAQFLRNVCKKAAPTWPANIPAIICAKGIEQRSCALMSEVVSEVLPEIPIAVLSGPTFAMEVALDLPTAVTLACNDESLGSNLIELMKTSHFRIYRSRDLIGAQSVVLSRTLLLLHAVLLKDVVLGKILALLWSHAALQKWFVSGWQREHGRRPCQGCPASETLPLRATI